jgi:hypothetical protein
LKEGWNVSRLATGRAVAEGDPKLERTSAGRVMLDVFGDTLVWVCTPEYLNPRLAMYSASIHAIKNSSRMYL